MSLMMAIPPLCLANRKRKLECCRAATINRRSTKQQKLDEDEESKLAEIDKTTARLFITSLPAISNKLNHASSTTLRCITKDLDPTPSCTDILSLRQLNTHRLLRDRKLILVLDLDNTLLHTVNYESLTLNEEISLKFDHQSDAFEWGGGNIVTKLRPHAHTFLKEASKMYDMYIYTMGSRAYALQMSKFLDPEGVYFGSKVISREDCTRPRKKGLDVVLAEERLMVIIDDKERVWKRHRKNLLVIDKYRFFGHGRRYQDIALMMKLHELESIHQFFFSDDDTLERGDVRDVIRGMIGKY